MVQRASSALPSPPLPSLLSPPGDDASRRLLLSPTRAKDAIHHSAEHKTPFKWRKSSRIMDEWIIRLKSPAGGIGKGVDRGKREGKQTERQSICFNGFLAPFVRSFSLPWAPGLFLSFFKMMEREGTNERRVRRRRGSNFRRSERLSEMFIPFLPSALTHSPSPARLAKKGSAAAGTSSEGREALISIL